MLSRVLAIYQDNIETGYLSENWPRLATLQDLLADTEEA
jgi:hypothetical protein